MENNSSSPLGDSGNSKKVNVLILEDDETLAGALKEALSRAGHNTILASNPFEARQVIEKGGADFAFVDCLLPQTSGVDFVEALIEQFPELKAKFILMSGIYTDKSYIQEVTKKTHAIAFLRKPFDLEEAIKLVRKENVVTFSPGAARRSLYQFFNKPNITTREKRKVLESLDEVSGFDLPFVYSLLSETKSSGYLNIYWSNKSVSGVSFSNGCIIGVDIEDKATLLGEMLIQSGYALPEDVKFSLKDQDNRKRLGQRLIHNNQLSPHGFDMILQEQMNIRLSRTVVDEPVKINFSAAEVEMLEPCIDSDSLMDYIHDWIASKISVAWLKNLYVLWSGHSITRGLAYNVNSPALKMSIFNNLDGLLDKIEQGASINNLIENKEYNPAAVYKAIHFLLTKGLVVFNKKVEYRNDAEQVIMLRALLAEFKGKPNDEILRQLEIGSAEMTREGIISEFLELIGPEPTNHKSEAHQVWAEVKAIIDKINGELKGPAIPSKKVSSAKIAAEIRVKAQNKIDGLKNMLQLNQFARAYQVLGEVAALTTEVHNFYLYSAWCKLGVYNPGSKTLTIKDIEFDILQIPPDEKYESIYPFVMGLFQKANGETLSARKSFEKALALDPTLIVARRELGQLDQQRKKQDVFNMDLKDVVTGFFKRK